MRNTGVGQQHKKKTCYWTAVNLH